MQENNLADKVNVDDFMEFNQVWAQKSAQTGAPSTQKSATTGQATEPPKDEFDNIEVVGSDRAVKPYNIYSMDGQLIGIIIDKEEREIFNNKSKM